MTYSVPGIERAINTRGGLGYTDYRRIYVAPNLPKGDDFIVTLHELCHIWLRHKERAQRKHREQPLLWNIACDLEIAKHCYDSGINTYMSISTNIVSGGIKRSDADKYPDCAYAEEYFEALIAEQAPKLPMNWVDMDLGGGGSEEGIGGGSQASPRELIEQAKEGIGELQAARTSSQTQEHVARSVGNLPIPSLSSELDRHLGRYRITGKKSYRRPPRFSAGNGLLRKGRILTANRPKITLYVDRSGSFTPEKTATAENKLAVLIARYGASVTYDVLEFSDKVGVEIQRGRGTNYVAVHESVTQDMPLVAVIITDDDGCPPLKKIEGTHVLVLPVGCAHTEIAKQWPGAVEVS